MRAAPQTCSFLAALLLASPALSAPDRFVRYDVGRNGSVQIVTELILTSAGGSTLRHELAPASEPAAVRALDRASGKAFPTRMDGRTLVVNLGPTAKDAEQRIAIEERVPGGAFVEARGESLVFRGSVSPGRNLIVLPPMYTATRVSVPAQIASEDDRIKVGIVVATGDPLAIVLEMQPSAVGSVPLAAPNFRAQDDRALVYWLSDPVAHRIDLAIDMCVARTGQAHAYSVLRKEDNITNARTIDLDRGIELPTRILAGSEAAALGDDLAFPPDASVFVADLGYKVQAGSSARVRLFQTATDPAGYRLLPTGEIRFDRFVARLHTRAVLPDGWVLTSVDQPAVIGRDERGRVTLDFLQAGADSPKLVVTARKATANAVGSGK